MDEQKLTGWFPPEVLPARPGWYLRGYYSSAQHWMDEEPDYFDGEHWYYGVGEGWYDPRPKAGPPNLRWRGLADPPLTDWFDPGTPPEREGVYEIEGYDGFRHFAYWTPGHGWGAAYFAVRYGDNWAIRAACQGRSHRGLFAPRRRWRGLAVQP